MKAAASFAAIGAMASLVAIVPARADRAERTDDYAPTASMVVAAALADEPGVLVALMDRAVAHDLDAPACGKAFTRPGRVAGRARAQLAACLVELGKARVLHAWPTYASEPPRVAIDLDDAVLELELVRVKGALRVRSIDLTWKEEEEGELQLGVPDGVADGVEGGVEGGVDSVPLPPPPKLPMFVPGRVLEAHRTAGAPRVAADERTRAALAEAGASGATMVMVCVDPAGAIAKARVVRGSGAAAFDRRIEASIRSTWRFRPVEIRGLPKEVCGGVAVGLEERP